MSSKAQIQSSPHFHDGQFHNKEKSIKSFWSFLKMRLRTTYAQWPKSVPMESHMPQFDRVSDDRIVVTSIGHSTVLIQTQSLNILTDPIFSDRSSPFEHFGPRRVSPPAIEFHDLPKIDIVLISHDHYDHLDQKSLLQIWKRDNPQFFMGLGVSQFLPKEAHSIELDWWESSALKSDIKIHFTPTQHWSGRGLFGRNKTLWGAFVVETSKSKIYFGGDTGYSEHFQETFQKFGPMDVSLLPIGAYAPRDFMQNSHINPEEAVKAHLDLKSKRSIGIHYGTFQLTAEPIHEPKERLQTAMAEANIRSQHFLTPTFGKAVIFDQKDLND